MVLYIHIGYMLNAFRIVTIGYNVNTQVTAGYMRPDLCILSANMRFNILT